MLTRTLPFLLTGRRLWAASHPNLLYSILFTAYSMAPKAFVTRARVETVATRGGSAAMDAGGGGGSMQHGNADIATISRQWQQ